MPEALITQMRARLEPELIKALVDRTLLDEAAKEAKITVTDEEVRAELEKSLKGHLVRTGATREEFAEQIKSRMNKTLDEFLAERVADAEFKRVILHTRLLDAKFPKELAVSPEEVKARYDEELEQAFSQPAMVRASHILIGTQGMDDAAKAAARKEAERILAEAREPGADFAALAAKYSTCPSKAQGGDLGFFPREDAMVEPFAAAAFELTPGKISDVVETQFGYHIIKVTERKDAHVVTLDQARETITDELHSEKLTEVRDKYLEQLHQAAKIVYAEGVTTQPATPPAAPMP